MADNGAGVGATARDPARRAEPAGPAPRPPQRERQADLGAGADDEVRRGVARLANGAPSIGERLRKLRESGAVAQTATVDCGG
jgi:hypothetical protein